MICRKCQAQIADKAIVCYRCGTPTAMPVPTSTPGRRTGGFSWMLGFLIGLASLALWWRWPGEPTDTVHIALAAVAVLALIVAMLRWLRSRR